MGAGKLSFLPVILVLVGVMLWFIGTFQLEQSGNGSLLPRVGEVTKVIYKTTESINGHIVSQRNPETVGYEGMFLPEQATVQSCVSRIPGLIVLLIMPIMALIYYYKPYDKDLFKYFMTFCVIYFVIQFLSLLIVYGSQRGFSQLGNNAFNKFMYYPLKQHIPGSELFQHIYGLKYAIRQQQELIFYFAVTTLCDLLFLSVPIVSYKIFSRDSQEDYSGIKRICVNCGHVYAPDETTCVV